MSFVTVREKERQLYRAMADEKRILNILWSENNPYVQISKIWLDNRLRRHELYMRKRLGL